MGNCLTLYRFQCGGSAGTRTIAAGEQRKAVVQVVKKDGKILEFAASVLVKDLLVKFPGFGVGLSAKAPECLPLTYELKLGNIYFLFPLLTYPAAADRQAKEKVSQVVHTIEPTVIKTIKVVITKKQLDELISKKICLETVVSEIKCTATSTSSADSPRAKGWQPVLGSIPEGN